MKWQQRADETDKAFKAFTFYRDLEQKRSLAKAAAKYQAWRKDLDDVPDLDTAPTYVQDWSTNNSWVERAKAYDQHLEQKRLAESETALVKGQARLASRLDELLDLAFQKARNQEAPIDRRMVLGLLDRAGLVPVEKRQVDASVSGSVEAGKDKIRQLLPEVGNDRREDS